MNHYVVLFEINAQGHFGAWVPDLPGCISFGDTIEEAKRNIKEAIELHIEGLKAENLPVPHPTTHSGVLSVAV
jgi:predicted RNase H-like HicB family nuclease